MMKRITYFLSTLAFVLAFSGNTFAQNVTASAQIVTSIDYTVDQNLFFGQLGASFSSNVILDPTGATTVNLGGGATDTDDYGKVTITGDPNATFTVTISDPTDLTNGTDNIGFSGLHYGENVDEDPTTGATSLASGTQHKLTTNGSSKYYIYLGGVLTAPGSAISSGEYTGDIQITVSYL